MHRYDPDRVHIRVDYVQYSYNHKDNHLTVFENFTYPIAAYNHEGIIMGANWLFREQPE